MTDQTQPTGSAIITIDAIEQQLATIANVDLEAIGQQIGAIWDEAEKRGDLATIERVSMIWQNAQQQHASLNTVTNVAATAIGLGKNIAAQRDAALEEYKNLAEAVENFDDEHPVVADLMDAIEADGIMWEIELSGERVINAGFCDLFDGPAEMEKVARVTEDFLSMIFCDDMDAYSQELRRRALDLLISINPDIAQERARYNEQQRIKREQEHAEWLLKQQNKRAAKAWGVDPNNLDEYDVDDTDIDEDEDDDLDA